MPFKMVFSFWTCPSYLFHLCIWSGKCWFWGKGAHCMVSPGLHSPQEWSCICIPLRIVVGAWDCEPNWWGFLKEVELGEFVEFRVVVNGKEYLTHNNPHLITGPQWQWIFLREPPGQFDSRHLFTVNWPRFWDFIQTGLTRGPALGILNGEYEMLVSV